MEQKPISHAVAGLIISGILIVFSLAIQFLDLMANQWVGYISLLILVVGLIIFINMYGKANNHYVSFGKLFSYGFKATGIIILVSIAATVLMFLVFPELKEKSFEIARENALKQGASASEVAQGMEFYENMFWPLTIGTILLSYGILGAIGSLIGAAITKKRPVNPLDQLDS